MLGKILALGEILLGRFLGEKIAGQIWPWGWGFEQPMTAPLFSKTCTQVLRLPRSADCSCQVRMTRPISAALI